MTSKNLCNEITNETDFMQVNPDTWNRQQVIDWIKWCSSEYALHDIPFSKFEMNGKALCMLTEDMFKQRVPNSGDILYRALKNLLPRTQQEDNKQQIVNSELPGIKLELNDSSLICAKNTQDIAQTIEKLNNNSSNIACLNNKKACQSNKITNTSNYLTNITTTNESQIKQEPDTMKPNLASDASPTYICSSSSSSSLLLQKSTSKFMPLITNMNMNKKKSKYNYKENSDDYDENDNEMADHLDNDEEEEEEDEDGSYQQSHMSKITISATSTPCILNTNSPNYERKRTANLENLIGNLKVRKLNQSSTGKEKHNYNDYASNNGNKMTSLYVDIAGVGATSLSDCSPSTPPLSSPSVSPSSLSIASDSPIHASSFSSSSSSLANHNVNNNDNNNKTRYSMVPKFRWIIESGSDANFNPASINLDNNDLKSVAALNGFDPTKINEIINESGAIPWCNDIATNNNQKTKPKTPKLTKKQQQAQDGDAIKASSVRPALSTGHKNQEDPSRQIKFYDDFIDFRGDVLRRPPDSKNCRILWEYLYLLLQNPNYSTVIRWEDETNMVFRIVQAEKLAALWGLQKNRLGMTYEKLSRGMRYYYPNNIIAREPGRRLLYRFMRHPDEIKKFVKKNGTYMLKRAKMNAKNNESIETGTSLDESIRTSITDINPDDSGVDEPLNGSIVANNNIDNKSKQTKKKPNDSADLNAMNNKNENKNKNHSKNLKAMSNSNKTSRSGNSNNENEEECHDEEVDENIEDEELVEEDDNNNRDDSTLDEEVMEHSNYKIDSSSISSSPYSGISHNSSTFKQNTDENNGDIKSNSQQTNAAAAFLAAAANAMTGANRLYPDLYSAHDFFQYYAAAAGLQQSPSSMASSYFSRLLKSSTSPSSSSKDDVNAAQFLLQLRNQNDNQFNFENNNGNNQFLSETIKNFTNNINRTSNNNMNNNMNNNNNNINNNMQKSKRASIARSNDLSSASSTSSNSSLEHSIDYENNNEFRNNNQFSDKSLNRKSTKPKFNHEEMRANYLNNEELKANNTNNSYEYPLNLSAANNGANNNIKKRKSKYDI